MKPILISFALCPFVQRSVITMLHKQIDFEIKYIDLANKPDWFLSISPFGKVPVLQVGDTVLFESAVINEYLDETNPPSLHPADPLKRAHNRAWIEFGASALFDAYYMGLAKDAESMEKHRAALRGKLEKLEHQLDQPPYFNGTNFSLVDAALAPLYMRLEMMNEWFPQQLLDSLPKTSLWKEALLTNAYVQKSVLDDFKEQYYNSLKTMDGHYATLMS